MKGKYYALNFPLRDGISDDNYKSVFEPVSNFLLVLEQALKIFFVGDSTSYGVVRPFRDCPTVWHRFAIWRQTRLLEFVDARYTSKIFLC